jgi:hypothetical protein
MAKKIILWCLAVWLVIITLLLLVGVSMAFLSAFGVIE